MDLWETVGSCGLYASSSGYGPMADPCEHGNESSNFIKRGAFLAHLIDF